MKTLFNIEGNDVNLDEDGVISFTAEAMIDDDGSGPAHNDPDEQSDTSLHLNGQPLNADVDKYIVVPPQIIEAVSGIVLGCRAHVRNTLNNLETEAVVADQGPRKKLGEMSIACAKALGISSSPTTGGEDRHVIFYAVYPGVPANVDGKIYNLQPI